MATSVLGNINVLICGYSYEMKFQIEERKGDMISI